MRKESLIIIDELLKDEFKKTCKERGLEYTATITEVVEYAMELFIARKIKSVKEQIREVK